MTDIKGEIMLENIKMVALVARNIIWSLFPPTLLYALTKNMTLSVGLLSLIGVAELLSEISFVELVHEQDFQGVAVEIFGEKE